ncbi:cell division protein SepF [Halalkalibacter krulwichiae]|uniref:Cell division protein SepF n=1 Tax=Halalkalibacter krulwichiae TaxID=199441 RepID=A0A1X9MCE2_9BACI|nr:cell division protein SepF [Halalkalibacter krulwichiae]ARK31078.1 Cell division protein SepF [Halalkalibacter krulwichiae]
MGMKSRFKRFFELEDEYEEVEEFVDNRQESVDYEQKQKPRNQQQNKQQPQAVPQNVVSLQSVQKGAKVILLEPRTYDEAQEIADHLKNRKAVIINLQRISYDQAKRIVDFLSGTVYAIGGDIQKIGANIFLCTPDNVDVTGTITEMMQEHFEGKY